MSDDVEVHQHFAVLEPVIFGKRQFRAPFRVDFCIWSPRSELLIIASKKGDVVLQRSGWKKCWRISMQEQVDPLSSNDEDQPRTIECINWSPNGDFFTVGMSDGHLINVYADSGSIFWKKLISDPSGIPVKITSLLWSDNIEAPDLALDGMFRTSIVKERDENTWTRSILELESLYIRSLHRKYLFVSRDDMKISILIAGLFPVGIIDLTTVLEPLGLSPFVTYDMYYDIGREELIMGVTSHGPPVLCMKDNTLSTPEKGEGQGVLQTHVIGFPITSRGNASAICERYFNVCLRWMNCQHDLDKIMKDWQTQIQIFINRLIPSAKNLNLGACLVSFCLNGNGTPLGEAYVERTIASNLNGLIEFIYNHFETIVNSLNGEFAAAVRTTCFHLEKLAYTLDELLMRPEKLEENIKASISTMIRGIRELSLSFQKSVAITVQACVQNISELLEFVKWLSVLPGAEKNGKRKMPALPQLAKMDISNVLKYLVDTFIDDEDMAENLNENIFDIDAIVKKEKKLEADGFYRDVEQSTSEKHEDYQRTKAAILRATDKKRKIGIEEGTPYKEKTTLFRKTERASAYVWKEKLDKVSDLWTKEENISWEQLKKLGLATEENKNIPNIKKHLGLLKKFLFKMDCIMEQLFVGFSPKWMCELGSGLEHQGYACLRIEPLYFHNESSRVARLIEEFRIREHRFGESLIVACHDKKHFVYKPISFQFGVRHELSFTFQCGLSCSSVIPVESTEETAELRVQTDRTLLGELIEINDIYLENEGFLYVLGTIKSVASNNTRHLFRWHPSRLQASSIHDLAFRPDQFEKMSFMLGGIHGCFTSDDSTRVNVFRTNPDENEDFILTVV